MGNIILISIVQSLGVKCTEIGGTATSFDAENVREAIRSIVTVGLDT